MKFSECPFTDSLHRDIAAAGYHSPTPIQAQCLALALEGRDVIGLAQTGTGKTAAFALPVIQRMGGRPQISALVLAPTRELVQQIVGVVKQLGRSSDIRVMSLVGGIKVSHDHKALRGRPNVLVATPGRLLDHLDRRTVSLAGVEMLIVDEADRMHDMGFMPQIRRIIEALPPGRQTMMFTATMPPDVEQVARRHMRDPVKIQVGAISKPVERAEQRLLAVEETQKMSLLVDMLEKETGRVLVFVRTKRRVDRLARRLSDQGYTTARLHGDREMRQRQEAMEGFRTGRYRILVATDIAARGLDVADIEHVINCDFPRSPEDYVHRIGRTARLEATGKATSFVTPDDRSFLRDLEKHLGHKMVVTSVAGGRPAAAHHTAAPAHAPAGHGGQGSHASHSAHQAKPAQASHASHPAAARPHGGNGNASNPRRRNRNRRRQGSGGSGHSFGHGSSSGHTGYHGGR